MTIPTSEGPYHEVSVQQEVDEQGTKVVVFLLDGERVTVKKKDLAPFMSEIFHGF